MDLDVKLMLWIDLVGNGAITIVIMYTLAGGGNSSSAAFQEEEEPGPVESKLYELQFYEDCSTFLYWTNGTKIHTQSVFCGPEYLFENDSIWYSNGSHFFG
jgi:hypothetical protein